MKPVYFFAARHAALLFAILFTTSFGGVSAAPIVFSFPGAVNTYAYGINSSGNVVGNYSGASGDFGFLRLATGSFVSIAAPTSTSTVAVGINTYGTISGFYLDNLQQYHGFLRDSTGEYLSFNVPGSSNTYARGINDIGQVVGNFNDAQTGVSRGFIREIDGSFIILDAAAGSAVVTNPSAINNLGQVVGTYNLDPHNGSAHNQGFVRNAMGAYELFDVPGATDTLALGVNNIGGVVGWSVPRGAFRRDSVGTYFFFAIPGSTYTSANGINDSSTIVGEFSDGRRPFGFIDTGNAVSAIPEPSSLTLTCLCLAGLAVSLRPDSLRRRARVA